MADLVAMFLRDGGKPKTNVDRRPAWTDNDGIARLRQEGDSA
jgi:hypothetical protein